MKLKKFAWILPVVIAFVPQNADAAAVAGSDYWDYLSDEEWLTEEEPFAIYGGAKYELNKISAPNNYPKTFHENKHHATAYVGFGWRFAPNWSLNASFTGERKWRQDHSTKTEGAASAYVEGKLGIFTIRGGGVPVFDALNLTNGGLVINAYVLGGQVKVPVGNWNILATGGVIDNDDYDLTRTTKIFGKDSDSTYLSLQAYGDFNKKLSGSLGVHNMHNTAAGLTFPNGVRYSPNGNGFFEGGTEKDNTVVTVGVDYKIDDNFTFGGAYAKGNAKFALFDYESEDKSYSVQLTYGKPELAEKNNTSAWLAYRQIGTTGSYTSAFHGVGFGERGVEVGVRHYFMKNLSGELVYFSGKKNSPLFEGDSKPKVHNLYFGAEFTL